MRPRRSGSPVVGLALAATLACGAGPTGLSEDLYVEVTARLLWARLGSPDRDAADSARAALLERYGVTGQELLDFAERHGGDPEYMFDLWERIRLTVDSLDAVPTPESEGGPSGLEAPDAPPP